MPPRTLVEFFADLRAIDGEFVVSDDGYRTWSYTYAEIASMAEAFAVRLRAAGIARGQPVAIWSENRPEWIAALWGCILEGVPVVPIDYRASAEFTSRVCRIVEARAVLVGETVAAASLPPQLIWSLDALDRPPAATRSGPAGVEPPAAAPDDTAEIIFTSGATADPKGVVLSHRNILANVVPIEREIEKYRRWARPFLPLRFLNLLPLSHMFGQAMATFIPPLLPGVVVFTRSFAPEEIVRQVRGRRVSVIVCVPKMLEVLRDHVIKVEPDAAAERPAMHWAKRWWRYRRVHRMFGLKFWAFVVGAAPLDPELEAFWTRLGFVVVQGYGLTETAPIVTLNHPLHAARGAVGKPIAGVEVRIADDGEILVRGDNVTREYFKAPEETREALRDGWFHTGDIGGLDDHGRLFIRGRKKEMIVTPEGLNVFPDDVERALNEQTGVRESAVVGAPAPGSSAERVQAVLVLEPGTNVDAVIRGANLRLQDHQRVRAAAVWPEGELPRTEGTRKLKRRELRQWLEGGTGALRPRRADAGASPRTIEAVLSRFAPGRTIGTDTTVDELGLTSLERVELMMALEDTLQVTIDEGQFAAARTVADLQALTRPIAHTPTAASRVTVETIAYPRWNRSRAARVLRRVSLPTWILPGATVFARLTIEGVERLRDVHGPVIFAANHQSHLDTPAILAALPPRLRYRVAPAMAKDFFKAHFYPEGVDLRTRLVSSASYYLAALLFNAFPLPQREAGTRQTLRYAGDLISDGYSILIFPEGKRTLGGEINPFQPGVGMLASRLRVPVVPVRVEGLDRVLHATWRMPRRGPARVAFGAPMLLNGSDYAALANGIESAVRSL